MPQEPRTAVERRVAQQSTVAPPFSAKATRCETCGATYLDYLDGRDAHLVVFGHTPPSQDDAQEPA